MSYRSHSVLGIAAALALSTGSLAVSAAPDGASGGGASASAIEGNSTQVLDTSTLGSIADLLDKLADRRVIFVGEQHDRYEDHLNQLAVIQGLKARGKTLAIGMEMFQQPYQEALDAYIRGEIEEDELLRRTEYFDRWRFDYRLYRPILRYAREQGIPIIALNLEAELTSKVGDAGLEGLSDDERARAPAEIDRTDQAYRHRIETVFKHHPADQQRDFEHFFEVQLLWDEGMAERAAKYLEANPERTLVVLAGGGHLEYGQGIPARLVRRVPAKSAILLNGLNRSPEPDAADFFLYPGTADLPRAGMLGVMLNTDDGESGMVIDGFADDSGAKQAGLEAGDRIVRIGGQPVERYADVRIAMMDVSPGDKVQVEVVRGRVLGGDERKTVEVELR